MAKQINVSIGGVKKSTKVYACIGNVIKQIKKGVCGVGGVVKEFFASELVLYDGTSFTNGAVQNGSYGIDYEGDVGFLSGKKLVVKFKSAITNTSYIRFTAFYKDSDSLSYYYGPSGNYSVGSYMDIHGTWSANTEYIFSKFENVSNIYKIRFEMRQTSDGLKLVFKNYFSYVALRD